MNNELPYQTYERVTGKKWTGGNSADVQNAYKQYGITAPAGSSEGNLALQKALMGNTTPAPATTVTQPTQPAPKNANIPTNPFIDTEMSDFEKEKNDYLLGLTNQPQIDRQAELNKFQAQIDAVNSMYADELARARVAGQGRLGTTTAIAGRRGLIGSDFGEAQVRGTEDLNENIYQSIERERNNKIQAIMSEARNYADNKEAERREQMLAGFDARTAYYKQRDERKKQNITSAVQALITQGLDPMELGNLKEFASYYGLNENDVKTNYKTEKERIERERQAEMLKNFPTKELSQGEALMVWNPETGKYEQQGYNPKTSVAQTGGTGSGINNTMIDNERGLMSNFRAEPIVKDYNEILGQKGTIDAYIQNGVGGPADLALVFSFMKGLDPKSVVRETEYANAAKSGNIFQGAWAKFNGYFKEKGGTLPNNVKQEFQNLVNQRLAVKKAQYDNVKKQYEELAVRQQLNPQNVVLDYSAGGLNTNDPLGIR